MPVSDKTRKILWGRAANRCAFCRTELVLTPAAAGQHAVIGEECHIVARSPGGPRWRAVAEAELDDYENLLLLCGNHHKLIDDLPDKYTEALLRKVKRNHERWVSKLLATGLDSGTGAWQVPITQVETGAALINAIVGAHAGFFDNDELADAAEVALVGGFLESARDWGEIWYDIEPSAQTDARFQLSAQIRELHAHGFLVLAGRRVGRVRVGDQVLDDWCNVVVRVVREDRNKPVSSAEASSRTERNA
ncbi:MAG: HNH endonuclease signature motif containing protein [Phycisphaerales bacterium]